MRLAKNKIKDAGVMIVVPVLATILTISLHTNLLVSILLFFGLPSLFLAIRNPGILKKSFFFSLIASIPLSLFVDVFAAADGSWVITETIFPFKFYGLATVEVYFFSLFWVLYAVLFYEHFFDRGKRGDKFSPKMKYIAFIWGLLVFLAALIYLLTGWIPRVPYFYLLIGLASVIIPLGVFLSYNTRFVHRYVLIAIYFFFALILFEFSALQTGQWIFPGNFIGRIPFFGHALPVEELFIWMMSATPALYAYYEFFADDMKLRG